MKQWIITGSVCVAMLMAGCATVNKSVLMTPPASAGGEIIFETAMGQNEDAFAAGKEAAEALSQKLGCTVPHAIIMVDCFDSPEAKKEAIDGVASVFGKEKIFGGAVYGMYTQEGATDLDGVSLLAVAGDGLQVQAALVETMGASTLSLETQEAELTAALNAGGAALAKQIQAVEQSDLVILMGDAHSPKNQLLLDGFQSVAGTGIPVTGGSISKNDGLNYVYYRGQMVRDSVFAITLKGGCSVAQSGRQAKANDAVISTADEGSATAMKAIASAKPFALITYDCAGRMGKLDKLSDELKAIQKNVHSSIPIFGCYCAGEFGVADTTQGETGTIPVGRGWHVMFTALGK